MTLKKRAQTLLEKLSKLYPDAKIALEYSSNFELLVSVMLSAQTSDAQVNKVTKKLFPKYRARSEPGEIKNFAKAKLKELQNDIRSIGLYKTKARNIKKTANIILKKYGGKVPNTMNELLTLPGVGRKTANVVLGNTFGIAVDTHVKRLARQLGLSKNTNPLKIEEDLMRIFEKKDWPKVTHLLIAHGRKKLKLKLD